MVSSFDPHNMCAKVERTTAKTGCTSCTNWTISFKVQGFQTKTHLLQRHFIFLSFFQLKTFFPSNMQHSKDRKSTRLNSLPLPDALPISISFKVQGFQTKTHLLQRHFIFLSFFQLKTFFPSNMQHSKPHTEKIGRA